MWLGEAPAADAVAQLGEFGATEVRVVASGERACLPRRPRPRSRRRPRTPPRVVVVSTFVTKEIVTGSRCYRRWRGGRRRRAELVDGRVETSQTVFAATWNVRTRINADRAIVGVRPNTTRPRRPRSQAPRRWSR